MRGIIPLGDTGVRVATRLTLEAPRLLSAPDAAGHLETDPALIADVVVSGRFQQIGLRWSVGVYNLFDWRYQIPVGSFFASPTMPQLGRSFMASLDLTY
jgi:outer membrane receptor protein involved in Fe transport